MTVVKTFLRLAVGRNAGVPVFLRYARTQFIITGFVFRYSGEPIIVCMRRFPAVVVNCETASISIENSKR